MTGKTVVPEEAVEAAARAWLERSAQPGSWTLEGSVRAALEAATPFIAAKAWQQGMEYSLSLLNGEELAASFRKDNPYRAAAVRGEG